MTSSLFSPLVPTVYTPGHTDGCVHAPLPPFCSVHCIESSNVSPFNVSPVVNVSPVATKDRLKQSLPLVSFRRLDRFSGHKNLLLIPVPQFLPGTSCPTFLPLLDHLGTYQTFSSSRVTGVSFTFLLCLSPVQNPRLTHTPLFLRFILYLRTWFRDGPVVGRVSCTSFSRPKSSSSKPVRLKLHGNQFQSPFWQRFWLQVKEVPLYVKGSGVSLFLVSHRMTRLVRDSQIQKRKLKLRTSVEEDSNHKVLDWVSIQGWRRFRSRL